MQKILVTPRSLTKSGHPELDKLIRAGYELVFSSPGRIPDESELINLIKDCSGYLAGVEKITRRVLKSAENLKVISRNGVGIDNIDVEAAKEFGIKICVAEGSNSRGVAELTIALIMDIVRRLSVHDKFMKSGVWERIRGIEIKDKILGIIGCGKIGKEVASLGISLGMKVIGYDKYPDSKFNLGNKFRYSSFDTVLSSSDIITLHLPANKKLPPIIGEKEIEKMKKGVFIINTARSALCDPVAIIKGLDNGIISGFAVDAFDKEPPKGIELELVKRKEVIATPHIGGYTEESIYRATRAAVDNLLKHI